MKQGSGKNIGRFGPKGNAHAVSLDATARMGAHLEKAPPPLFKKGLGASAPKSSRTTHPRGSQGER
jgi:hypothetical protein